MRTLVLALLISAGTMASNLLSQEAPEEAGHTLRVIPTPQQVVLKPVKFKFSSATRIVLGEGTTDEDEFSASQINVALREHRDLRLKTVKEESVRKLTSNFIFIGGRRGQYARDFLKRRKGTLTPEMKTEGYFLDVDADGVVIVAETAAGRFYGIMSLIQMIERQKKTLFVNGASIRDWPLQAMRGISDDLSRGQVSTMENFKKIIRFLARYKMNVYSPYIEDIFVFKNHPLIGKGRGALSAREIQELDVYAKRFHVELIPTFETLGHWENILAMPEYVKYAEFPGAHTLNVSDENVYSLLDEMIGELSAAFSSPYFNMAADESWDVGLGANKQRVAASDIATVHAEHYKRVFDILKKYRKKPMMYGDIILNNPAILDKIPKDVVIVDWHYEASAHYPSPEIFKTAGFPFTVSPAVMNFTGPFPNYINSFINIQNFNRDGYLNGSMGLLTSNWNDYGGEALRELNYYGYAWTAECSWQPLKANAVEFDEKFFTDFFGSPEATTPAKSVYAILSDPFNQMDWSELWRHPMLPLNSPFVSALWRVRSIESTMPLVRHLIRDAEQRVSRNKDHLLYLDFISRLNLWFAKKIFVGETVRQMTQTITPAANRDSVRNASLELMKDVVPELMKLKDDFRELWMRTNREANLQWLLTRYEQQAAYWTEKIEEIQRGDLWVNPVIESQWIYHPTIIPGAADSAARQAPKAYFRKTFSIDDSATSVKLQLIGDTQAKLRVNGKEVGEVYARRSLSLSVEHQRVRLWEVGEYVRKGKNVVAVEATNYNRRGTPGFNIYSEVKLSNGQTVKVLSDSTWRVTDKPVAGWTTLEFNDAGWLPAKVQQYPQPVIRPNFATGRLSWIDR